MPKPRCPAETTGASPAGWERGRGWGWTWGAHDDVGALNSMTPESRLDALRIVEKGLVYDLGVSIDRRSYVWAGHPRPEMLTFRSPRGTKSQGDIKAVAEDEAGLSFVSGMVVTSDHAGTHIDALCHTTVGTDDHWYNGFSAQEWAGDFGARRGDASSMPPILARGVLIDVAGWKGVDSLPPHYPVSAADLAAALSSRDVDVDPGDVVLIRTGALRYWGEAGEDHEALSGPDTAGISLEAARWLCEEKGAMLVGADTSTVEVVPPVDGKSWAPVHEYVLIEQGVHLGEFHYLEGLAADGVSTFCYFAAAQKIRGATAGFAMRPVALV